ncbi:MAG: nucleotidyltransferase domain-containing protein [Nitrospira sp.]|nr:nucleotidyltransferase domain-containing protein [bacterium]MBL7049497.1 nucleotidyltransferase domain-containing protein [Nitrospira sp.]
MPSMKEFGLDKGTSIVVSMKFGSHLYGTATSGSDMDYKGIFLPSREQVLLGMIPKSRSFTTGSDLSRNTHEDIDYEYYSLHYFIKLACEGQIVALDMLHATDDMILEKSASWDFMVENRKKFYTKNMRSFVDYARRQAAKYGIKGSRLSAVGKVIEILEAQSPEKKMREIWGELPRNEHCHDDAVQPGGVKQYQVCGKTFQESARIGYVIPILKKFYDEYGVRARQAAENRNIDWKAISHALRAAYQIKEILTDDGITFPLKEARFLIDVKLGRLDYLREVVPVLETLMDEVEDLALKSDLPETVDRIFWEQFICKTIESNMGCG